MVMHASSWGAYFGRVIKYVSLTSTDAIQTAIDTKLSVLCQVNCVPRAINLREKNAELKCGASLILGTLSNENGDGDGDSKTRKKTGEKTPLWREYF